MDLETVFGIYDTYIRLCNESWIFKVLDLCDEILKNTFIIKFIFLQNYA